MTILGIETSCDETAAAVVEDGTRILSNVVASSQNLHAKYGGIIPDKAAREQLKSILPVISDALSTWHVARSDLSTGHEPQATSQIDAIAVTVGPGLIGSLLVGVETAKALAYAWEKPIIPVGHLVGHIYANWISDISQLTTYNLQLTTDNSQPQLPAIVLIVSGGHTELVLMKDHGDFTYLGGTRDDAAGECFDKCARLLDLGYPGGPAVEAAASKCAMCNVQCATKLPRPMINEKNFDFSFSGLKTAVRNEYQVFSSKYLASTENKNQLAYELQEAVAEVLVKKTLSAAEKYQAKSILLAGGVAANSRLRENLKFNLSHSLETRISNLKLGVKLFIPPIKLCTDNAACIASAAYFNQFPTPWEDIQADPGLTATATPWRRDASN